MRNFLFLILFSIFFQTQHLSSQEMTSDRLEELIAQVSDTLMTNGNSIQFLYKELPLMCVYDANANRMRIITPIIETKELKEEQLLNMLVANFHSALDVKYALSDEIIWSVFIHPLKELSDHQVLDAINQVYSAAATFGTTYSSTSLVFPGNTKKKESPKQKKLIKRG
ncbi:hypothetical protein [Maribacter sp.]